MPKSEVPGEVSSPTQPFPTKPPPFARQVFKADDVNPFMPAAEDRRSCDRRFATPPHEGLFTPSSHLRYHIQFPGAWGGANWGSMAGRSRHRACSSCAASRCPAIGAWRSSAERQGPPPIKGGQREQDGYAVYAQRCAACHGPGQMPMRIARRRSALDRLPALVRQGQDQMPAFPETVLPRGRRGRGRSVSGRRCRCRRSRRRVER